MYLSRVVLPESVETVRLLADWHRVHHAVLLSCPRGAERALFRLEPPRRHDEGSTVIHVQCEHPPQWDESVWPTGTRFDTPKHLPSAFRLGYRLRFRLRANPTVKRMAGGKNNGCREGILGEAAQLAWLRRKAEAGGFKVMSCLVVDEKQLEASKPTGQALAFRSVLFEGVLEVTDPVAFVKTLQAGIGSGKAFGFGLLSLAKVCP